jgi:hypothetical protein
VAEWILAAGAAAVLACAGAARLWAQAGEVRIEINGAATVVGPVPAQGGSTIFIPKPKGAGETLDDSKATTAAERRDGAVTVQGDRLNGTIVAAEAGGKLRLTGPQFEGEVQVLVAMLDSIILKGDEKESGADEVVLTNGDRVVGELAAITPEGVSIETQSAGRLRISPKVIRTIGLARAAGSVIESNFSAGTLEPWTARGGSWALADDVLMCRNRGGPGGALCAKLEQKEAVTLVAKVQAVEGNALRCDLVVFADTAEGGPNEGRYGRNSIFAMFYDSEYYLHYVREGSTNSIVNRGLGRQLREGILRLAYDPATGKARMWVDSTDLGQYDVPNKPTAGQFVLFNSQYPLKVEYLAVLRGVVAPSGDDIGPGGPAADTTTIEFTNRDHVSVTSVSLADGQLVAATSYGELKCSIASASRIVFGKKDREEPRRQKGDVRVRTAGGRLTLQFDRLTADTLVGRSECLGEVKLRRNAVKEIKFNLYR